MKDSVEEYDPAVESDVPDVDPVQTEHALDNDLNSQVEADERMGVNYDHPSAEQIFDVQSPVLALSLAMRTPGYAYYYCD
jgi:hypothetical protein